MAFIIYITIIFLCLFFSLINPLARKKGFIVYFFVVAVVDIFYNDKFIFFRDLKILSPLVFTVLFGYYFSIHFKNQKILIWFLTIISALFIVYFVLPLHKYSEKAGVVLAIYYIVLTLLSLVILVFESTEILIYKKMFFWISCSLLFWAVFFIFRVVPMYFFNEKDPVFLEQISSAYQVATIISYFIFLKGLLCKV